MAVDPTFIDASAGAPAYAAQELRLGLIAPLVAGAGASLGARSGVRPSGSGLDFLVQAQASPNMTVKVNTGTCVIQGTISSTQGPYGWALDALLSSLTIAAAHATLTRTDLVCVRIRDANVDTSGQRDGAVMVVTGTAGGGVPALPTDATYVEIARITIVGADTAINTGDIADRRPFTAALGGVIPCTSTTEPSASTVPVSQLACRTDLGNIIRASDLSTWRMVAPYRQVTTLGGTTATIVFSGLPAASLKNITIRVTARGDTAAVTTALGLRINSDSGTNYYYINQRTTNATQAITNSAAQTFAQVGAMTANTAAASHFGQTILEFTGWSSSSHMLNFTYRSVAYPSQATSIFDTGCGVYNVVGPYTSITLLPLAGSFVAGTEAVLEAWD